MKLNATTGKMGKSTECKHNACMKRVHMSVQIHVNTSAHITERWALYVPDKQKHAKI